jgi:hypothetical protein
MTVEQANNQEGAEEKKPSEPLPLTKDEIEALKHYATGM